MVDKNAYNIKMNLNKMIKSCIHRCHLTVDKKILYTETLPHDHGVRGTPRHDNDVCSGLNGPDRYVRDNMPICYLSFVNTIFD